MNSIRNKISAIFPSSLPKKGMHAVVDQGVISGLNFLTFIVLAKWMSTDDFGVYILAFSVLMFVQTIQHALITRAHNVLGAKANHDDFNDLTRVVVKFVIGFSGLATGILLLSAWGASVFSWSTLTEASIALSFVTIPWLVQDAIRRILYTADRISAAVLNDFVCYGFQLGLIYTFFQFGYTGSQGTVFALLGASSALASVVGLFQIKATLLGFFSRKEEFNIVFNQLWSFGKWLTTGEFIGWIGQNGNTWIIGALLGAPLVAGYRAATYVTNLLNPLDLTISNYLPVKAAQIAKTQGHDNMIKWLRQTALLLCVPYAILVLSICAGSYWLLDLFFDARYVTDLFALILSVSAFARLLGFASNFARIGLMATENNRPIMYSQFISLGVFASLSIGFVLWFGVLGAPISRIFLHLFLGFYLTRTLLKSDSFLSHQFSTSLS